MAFLPYPRHPLPYLPQNSQKRLSENILPQNSQNPQKRLRGEYSPTDFTDAHRFLGCVFAPNLCTSVQSVGVFVGGYGILPYPRRPLKSSHGIHRIHRSFWRRRASHGFHRCPQMVRLRKVLWLLWEDSLVGCVGMAGMPYPPNLCTSVKSVGEYLAPETSVPIRFLC